MSTINNRSMAGGGSFLSTLGIAILITLGFGDGKNADAFNLDTRVRVRSSTSVPVPVPPNALAENVHLTKYMTLPVEQYALVPMPLNSTLSRMPGGSTKDFELVVPPVRFLWLAVQPVVHAIVILEDDKVVITGDKCTLKGSPFISKVELNDRFNFMVSAELTWEDTCTASSSMDASSMDVSSARQPEEQQELPDSTSTIFARTRIKVDVDVPRPFSAVPKRIIEKTGNKAMQLSLNYILRSFMKGLSSDYQRWASDPEYRRYRAKLAEEKQQEEVQEDEDRNSIALAATPDE